MMMKFTICNSKYLQEREQYLQLYETANLKMSLHHLFSLQAVSLGFICADFTQDGLWAGSQVGICEK